MPLVLGLDLGGVIIPAFGAGVVCAVAAEAGTDPAALEALFVRDLREGLWSGEMGEGEFWERLLAAAGLPGREAEWGARVSGLLAPLPAAGRVAGWARRARVVALSNHRRPWLDAALGPTGLLGAFAEVVVSSETGLVKPDPRAFAPLLRDVEPRRVLYVDDQAANTRAAAAEGMATILADPGGAGADEVDARLGPSRTP